MDQSLFIITIISLFMVIVLMGLVLYLGYNLLKAKMIADENKKSPTGPQYEIHEEVLKRLQEMNLPKNYSQEKKSPEVVVDHLPATEQYFCSHHPNEMSVGTCDICEKAFCVGCLKSHKNLHFCPEHLQVFMSNQWTQVASVKTNPEETKPGVILYHLKQDLWNKQQLPTYMETQYKIDVENDFIESFVALYARTNDANLIKEKFLSR